MAVKIDNSIPNRVSMSVTTDKQTQGSTFGEKVSSGLQNATSAIVSGASLVGGVIPGAGVVSTAVSAVGRLTNMPGSSSSAMGYSATGVVSVGGGSATTTTGGTTTGTSGINLTGGSSSDQVGTMNNELSSMTQDNAKLLQVQIALQHENTLFSSVSNSLKTKHDTIKNTISNVR